MRPKHLWLSLICCALLFTSDHLYAAPPTNRSAPPTTVPSKLPPRKDSGPVKGPVQTSKLFVYTQNGLATTRTSLSGEFPSQLSTTANVGGEFIFRWVRDKGGKEEKKGVVTITDSSGKVVGTPSATMPAAASAADIGFTFPASAKPGSYVAMVTGGVETSSKVTLNYTGEGAGSKNVTVPTPAPFVPTEASYKIRLAQFKPMVGTSKQQADYKPAELSFEINAKEPTQIKELRFEVYSKPFTNSEILTASGGPHAPIQLLTGKWTFKAPVQAGKTGPNVVHLKITSDYTKEGPGVSTPADWHIAYDKTDTATFKWSVNGQPGGSVEKPLHIVWDTPPWKEKDFKLPPPPKGPIKIPGKQ
jgi:hypothetical protein